ncbi:metallophosphoesterase family protein [Bartonella sp. A05]|uniref:metallophosphoesterase family protein n=1 Tax=Bartonella sp. A05 TaxID=2967261 RepID=UPI0022A9790A|nr:metallophosphoesterase family protein [Bartonella sp. A05]MCZ2204447.1 metallophosphoesterase [Bartonella sp. A05]
MKYKYAAITLIPFIVSGCLRLFPENGDELRYLVSVTADVKRKPSVKNYTAIIMADPQPWRLNSGDSNAESNRIPWIAINKQVAHTIKSHKAVFYIVNGDLTESGQQKNYNDYTNLYKSLGAPVYEGLGNHDYANNVGNCAIPETSNLYKDACAISAIKRMLSEIKKYSNDLSHFNADVIESSTTTSGGTMHFIKGSLSYSWDYEDIHYVQLHNHPSYKVHLKEQYTQVSITKSLNWLKKDLENADARGKVTIINFHDARPASIDGESHFIHTKNARDLSVFKSIIMSHQVKAIFVGHTHYQAYCRAKNDKVFGNIPVYTAGALFNGDYYLIDVKGKDIHVKAYNGEIGRPLLIKDLGIIGEDTQFSTSCSNF